MWSIQQILAPPPAWPFQGRHGGRAALSDPHIKKALGIGLRKGGQPGPSHHSGRQGADAPSFRASRTSVRPNTREKLSPPAFRGAPVSGSKGDTPWKASGLRSAGAKPFPFTVLTWSRTGSSGLPRTGGSWSAPADHAHPPAPDRVKPMFSNILHGRRLCFRAFFTPWVIR